MTLDDYITLLESPQSVEEEDLQPLRDLLGYAPYCVSARLLLLKGLYDNGHRKEASQQMQRAILSAPQEVSVYFLLNPKKIKRHEEMKRSVTTSANKVKGEHDLTYFELIDRMQAVAKKTGITFEELAKRYLDARQYSRES